MARRGTRIKIAEIEEFNGSFSKFCKNKTESLKGRPTKVILRLLSFQCLPGLFGYGRLFLLFVEILP